MSSSPKRKLKHSKSKSKSGQPTATANTSTLYAGPVFQNSPLPSSLPIPIFRKESSSSPSLSPQASLSPMKSSLDNFHRNSFGQSRGNHMAPSNSHTSNHMGNHMNFSNSHMGNSKSPMKSNTLSQPSNKELSDNLKQLLGI